MITVTIATDQRSLTYNGATLTFFAQSKEVRRCRACYLFPFGVCDSVPCTPEKGRKDGQRGGFTIKMGL